MKAQNNFQEDAWLIFQDGWTCWYCGQNHIDCLHHIVGRGNKESVVESSVFNAAPLNNQICHLPHHAKLRTDAFISAMLKQTKKYLENYGYIPTRNDRAFMLKYTKYYK